MQTDYGAVGMGKPKRGRWEALDGLKSFFTRPKEEQMETRS